MSVVGEIYGNDKVFPRVAECLYLKGRYVALAYIYTYIYSERIISRIVPVSFISLDMYDDGVYIVHTYVHARVSNLLRGLLLLLVSLRKRMRDIYEFRTFRYGNVVTIDSSLRQDFRGVTQIVRSTKEKITTLWNILERYLIELYL